jgi:hypothetical protein
VKQIAVALAISAAVSLPAAHAAPLFADNFETGLGGWVAKGGAAVATQAETIADPLVAGNNVLRFKVLNSGGSILSTAVFGATSTYTIEFDYLGRPTPGAASVPDDFGGFLGIGVPAGDPCNCWLAGTAAGYVTKPPFQPLAHLRDAGALHHYSITFTAPPGPFPGGFQLMVEDFSGSGGIAGDAYFDNISIAAVPEPGTYALLLVGLGLLGMAAHGHRRV